MPRRRYGDDQSDPLFYGSSFHLVHGSFLIGMLDEYLRFIGPPDAVEIPPRMI